MEASLDRLGVTDPSQTQRALVSQGNADARHYWAIAGVFAVISAVIYGLATRYGIGILPDSTTYMNMGTRPYDAPLYPWLLQIATLGVFDIIEAAWLLGLVLVCVNSALLWHLLVTATRRPVFAAVGTAFVVLSPTFVTLHSLAMSEPLFLTFMLLTFLSAMRFWETGRAEWLYACGLVIGALSLIRFTAPPFGAGIAITLLCDRSRRLHRRIRHAVIVGAVAGIIFFTWAIVSQLLIGRSTGRPLHLYGDIDSHVWTTSLKTILAWVAPSSVPASARAAVLLVVIGCAAILLPLQFRRLMVRNSQPPVPAARLAVALGLSALFYFVFMAMAITVEANLTLTSRYAFPPFVALAAMLTIGAASQQDLDQRWVLPAQRMLLAVAMILLAANVVRTCERTWQDFHNGLGYASVRWLNSPVLKDVKALPANATILSNGPDVIGYVTRRAATLTPARSKLRTGVEDPDNPFQAQLTKARRQLAAGNTYVVVLDRVDWRFYLASESDLIELLNLHLVRREPDGRIYTNQAASAGSALLPKETL